MQASVPIASSKQQWNPTARWFVLIGGVVNPVAFVLAFTVAGILRPGYSPIHQAISDLGVGPNGSVMDAIAVISGLLLIGFAMGFAISMHQVLNSGWRWSGTTFLVLRGIVLVTVAIFTEDPSTVRIHSLAATIGVISMLSALTSIGLGLRRNRKWRRWGNYSLVAALMTLVLVAVEFWVFTPGTLLAPLHLGGLIERVVYVETLAWYVAIGWQLFRTQSEKGTHQI